MQSHSTQNEMTSQLYDTLDISCQPGTATVTPTQLPAEPHDLHPQWDQLISTVCTCGLTHTNKQTNEQTCNLYPVLVISRQGAVNSILTKVQFTFSLMAISISNTLPANTEQDSGITPSAAHTFGSSRLSKTTSVLSVSPD